MSHSSNIQVTFWIDNCDRRIRYGGSESSSTSPEQARERKKMKPLGRSFSLFSYRLLLHEASTCMAMPPIVRRMRLPRSTALTPLDGTVNLLTRMLQWGFVTGITYCLGCTKYIVLNNQSMATHSVIDNRTNRTRMFWSSGRNDLPMISRSLAWPQPAEWRINLRAYSNRASPCALTVELHLHKRMCVVWNHYVHNGDYVYRAIGKS